MLADDKTILIGRERKKGGHVGEMKKWR